MPVDGDICTKCNKPGEYYPRGRKSWCKECCKQQYREWYRKNPEKGREYSKQRHSRPGEDLKVSVYRKKIRTDGGLAHEREKQRNRNQCYKRFGIDEAKYQAMLAAQGGVCAICHKPETRTRAGRVKRLAVDHEHKPGGRVRGLLCQTCNMALGHLEDSPDRIRSAVAYLRSHSG